MDLPEPRSKDSTAKELMSYWQSKHDKKYIHGNFYFEDSIIDIWNSYRDDDGNRHLYKSFSEAMELLCQAVEKKTFYKPIHVGVEGKHGQKTVLDSVEKNRLFNIQTLWFSGDWEDAGEHEDELKRLSWCIESGKLLNLNKIYIDMFGEKVNVVLLALATGRAPNLTEIEMCLDCDVATEETFVRAVLNKRLSKLRRLSGCGFELKDHIGILRVPQEFADKDNEDILAFLRERWEHGEVQLAMAKVILTGPTTVGKTCLVHCLKGNKFSPDPGSTNTMDIGKIRDGRFVLFYHDFAGQDVYALARAMFGQRSVVYLVLWDRNVETGGDEAAHQFTRDVLDVNPNAKFIFVTTKGDLNGKHALTPVEQVALKERYNNRFLGYYHVSAQSGVGVDELRAAIKSAAAFADVLMPKTYDELRKSLETLPESQWYIPRDELEKLCQKVGITGHARLELVIHLFQDMGEIVGLSTGHFVVKPSVLVDVLSRVVTADEKYKDNARGGYLRHSELDHVWGDYPKELHTGFLDLMHRCDIGFPVCDGSQDYKATLIPPMMAHSSGEEIRQGLKRMIADYPDFGVGFRILVNLSNLSDHLWIKFLVRLRGVLVFGGWSPRGCLIMDADKGNGTKIVRSFGSVVWDSKNHQVTLVFKGRSPPSVQLLRSRALSSLGATLKEFAGVFIESLRLTSFPDESWWEEWSRESLYHSTLDKAKLEKHDASDVGEWILELRKEAGHRTQEDGPFAYFMEMLQNDSVSDDALCYLMLKNQKEMLTMGCKRGRLDLMALWFVYDINGVQTAYPLCPHLHPKKVRLKKNLKVSYVPAVGLDRSDNDQIELDTLVERIIERLRIRLPSSESKFVGLLWNGDEASVIDIEDKTADEFQPVRVDGFDVFVHESDQLFFTSQVEAIKELSDKARESILEMRKLPAVGGECLWLDGKEPRLIRDGECESLSDEQYLCLSRKVPLYLCVVLFFVLFVVGYKMKKTISSRLRRLWANESAGSSTHLEIVEHMERDQVMYSRMRINRESPGNELEEHRFQDDPFCWLCKCFRDEKIREEKMESVLFHTPITIEIANEIKSKIRDRVRQEFPDFDDFYPEVIISYSTGSRKDMDVESAGPGLMVVGALIDFLFDQGHPCYSDIITPGGRDWREYMLRLVKAKVMVLLITDTFCRSVHCLEEVAEAVAHRVPIIPVRLDEKSVNGMDITRDEEAMWPDEELERYAQQDRGLLAKLKLQRFEAIRELSRGASIPDHGTILSAPNATDELLKRTRELLAANAVDPSGGTLHKKRKLDTPSLG